MKAKSLQEVDRTVQEFCAKLLEVGHLKRLNKQQHAKLHEAMNLVLGLPRRLREIEAEPQEAAHA